MASDSDNHWHATAYKLMVGPVPATMFIPVPVIPFFHPLWFIVLSVIWMVLVVWLGRKGLGLMGIGLLGCDALLKGTSVDGVYTADPKKDPGATRYDSLSYHDVLAKDLKVMDASAIALMRDSGIPIVVFSIRENNSLRRTLTGEGTFTVITSKQAA